MLMSKFLHEADWRGLCQIVAGDCTKCILNKNDGDFLFKAVAKKRTRERKTSRTSVRTRGASEGNVVNNKNMHQCKRRTSVISAFSISCQGKTRVDLKAQDRGGARQRCETAVQTNE